MRVDIVARGFDAGIHLGEFIERDMIAVRVSRDQRAAIVGSPSYFAQHARPKSPRDLTSHRASISGKGETRSTGGNLRNARSRWRSASPGRSSSMTFI
jgi:DNA-binding transcriptional LysR family regulator